MRNFRHWPSASSGVRTAITSPPSTFLGLGGRLLFRDEVYGSLRMVFQADHRFYRKHGWYNFPQKKIGLRLLNPILSLLFRIPAIRRSFDEKVKTEMIKPLEEVVEKETAEARVK